MSRSEAISTGGQLAAGRSMPVSVVIPTYKREGVLIESIDCLLKLERAPAEILIVDQTPEHHEETTLALAERQSAGKIRRTKLPHPSITHAMNVGLQQASNSIVLFLDDDIIPCQSLIAGHASAQMESNIVAGQVLQPGEEAIEQSAEGQGPRAQGEAQRAEGEGQRAEGEGQSAKGNGQRAKSKDGFLFRSSRRQYITELMGGNFSIKRDLALKLGGFDENFVHVAYRFEAEFAARALAAGQKILFEPEASIRHLKAGAGGTRAYGNHLTTIKPSHAVGEYYYLLRARQTPHRFRKMLSRPVRTIRTKHHLSHPWWIPGTLVAEASGFIWALALAARGPKLLGQRSEIRSQRSRS